LFFQSIEGLVPSELHLIFAEAEECQFRILLEDVWVEAEGYSLVMVELVGLGFDCVSYGAALGLLLYALLVSSLDGCLEPCDIDEDLVSAVLYRLA
jgi:hypothetical protein